MFDAPGGAEDGVIRTTETRAVRLPARIATAVGPAELSEAFHRLDLDGDGAVRRAEWARRLDEAYGLADLDGDGTVTVAERAEADGAAIVVETLGSLF